MKEQDRYSTFECALEAREARNDERVRSLNEELEHAMTQGLAGFVDSIPSFTISTKKTGEFDSDGDPIYTCEHNKSDQTAADAVLEALQSLEPAHALMMALQDSACPLVAKLRAEVVKQYVADNAEGIDAARGYK